MRGCGRRDGRSDTSQLDKGDAARGGGAGARRPGWRPVASLQSPEEGERDRTVQTSSWQVQWADLSPSNPGEEAQTLDLRLRLHRR